MATVNILPDNDISNSLPGWALSTGTSIYALIDDDDSGSPPSDGSMISQTSATHVCVVGLEDKGDYAVAGATINSIRYVIKANVYERGKSFSLRINLQDSSGASLYVEYANGSSSGAWGTFYGTARTTSDGSTAWTASDINDLRLHIEIYSLTAGGTMRVTYAYVEVNYTVAGAVTDNAIFFGHNF